MRAQRIFFGILILSAVTAGTPKSQEVIDLGSLKVEGAARGPELNVIESGMDENSAGLILNREISRLENELLESELLSPGEKP
jgi:hypothetical protein